ncbi:hypothetical protein E1176_19350 [Fulvivirga sp. RKSG066]|uniref:hypothetical protein n=1 Tax=Fulvivirga aurantia TaxID=2529383 RepID=UPI0012BC19DE|nr:hypothetical protein [Fulvivirga aurantia]MTI23195.1 hypothetical protein [Fulvivirga aurantia]
MKTSKYNPSDLEVAFAQSLEDLKDDIQKKLPDNEIIKIENRIKEDNPLVKFYLLDNDGDPHEIVLKVIQTPDRF